MATPAHISKISLSETILHMAFELAATKWKLAFTTRAGRSRRERTIPARDPHALKAERKQRLHGHRSCPAQASTVSRGPVPQPSQGEIAVNRDMPTSTSATSPYDVPTSIG